MSDDFKPFVKPGDIYSVDTVSGVTKHYQCLYTEGLPKSIDLIEDFGSISASSVSRNNKLSILEMEGGNNTSTSELAQLRMEVLDDVTVTVKLPSASSKFKTRNSEIRVDYNSDPESTEFFINADDTCFFDVYNLTQYQLTKTRVAFWGWRIVGTEIEKQVAETKSMSTGNPIKHVSATGFIA